ncbi:MAG: hypothetical protein ABIH72_02620 [archaeon]
MKDNLEEELKEFGRVEPIIHSIEQTGIKKNKGPNLKTLIPAGLVALAGFSFVCGMDYAAKKIKSHEINHFAEQNKNLLNQSKNIILSRGKPEQYEPEKNEESQLAISNKKEVDLKSPASREKERELAVGRYGENDLRERLKQYWSRLDEIKEETNPEIMLEDKLFPINATNLVDKKRIQLEIRAMAEDISKESNQEYFQELLEEVKEFNYVDVYFKVSFAPLASLFSGKKKYNKRIIQVIEVNPYSGKVIYSRHSDNSVTEHNIYSGKTTHFGSKYFTAKSEKKRRFDSVFGKDINSFPSSKRLQDILREDKNEE